jgi:NAD-dependent SIR2 family protein deacetylase
MSALPQLRASGSLDALHDWIARHRRVFVLTGAGCSTQSGISDYRDVDGAWKRKPPVMYQAFVGDDATYRRYWARSHVGWPRFSQARPNAAHHAIAAWQAQGTLSQLVTQNVDGLHQRAGHRDVVDLHGCLDEVVCLDCGLRQPRDALQQAIAAANAGWHAGQGTAAPDGDADIDDAAVADFVAPRCGYCEGLLKPDVVFFGENVPRLRYERARDALLASDAMLVAGSSLMVYSGFRFARMAHEAGLPVAVVNRGRTRADGFAALRLDADVGEALQAALQVGVRSPAPLTS